MRLSLFILFVILAVFAVLQYNDPDSLLWFAVYAYAAAVILATFFGRHTVWPAWLGACGFLTGFIHLAPTITSNWIEVETAREAFGLLICAMSMMYVNFYLRLQANAETIK